LNARKLSTRRFAPSASRCAAETLECAQDESDQPKIGLVLSQKQPYIGFGAGEYAGFGADYLEYDFYRGLPRNRGPYRVYRAMLGMYRPRRMTLSMKLRCHSSTSQYTSKTKQYIRSQQSFKHSNRAAILEGLLSSHILT
jgi:hypothetical protein